MITKFKDLSNWLKLAVITAYFALGYWALVFVIAFISEIVNPSYY